MEACVLCMGFLFRKKNSLYNEEKARNEGAWERTMPAGGS